MGKLTAVYGPMFAGKTTWILKRIDELERAGEKCLVFKPRIDDRYGKEAMIHAHDGGSARALLVDHQHPQEMLGKWVSLNEQYSVVVIDEAMLFSMDIVESVRELLARDLHVIVAGLDTNYRKDPFGPMPRLIKMADEQVMLSATCYKCGGPARYSARLKGGEGKIVVGGADSYQPACENCHTIYQDEIPQVSTLPYMRCRIQGRYPRIEVMADSMRVGKTTAVKVIAEGLRARGYKVTESYEDWQHNPYLAKSYSDPAKDFLASQKWSIKRKHQQIVDGVGAPLRSASFEGARQVFIQDVSPEMDYCYAETNRRLGRISDENFAKYAKYYHTLDWKLAPAPDVLVYLSVSDEVLLRRAMDSRREFETVEPEYFLTMKQVNREWLGGANRNKEYKILEIDTDKLDFAHDTVAKEQLVDSVALALFSKNGRGS